MTKDAFWSKSPTDRFRSINTHTGHKVKLKIREKLCVKHTVIVCGLFFHQTTYFVEQFKNQ